MFGGGAYIWNELSVSVMDLYSVGLILLGGEAYSRGWGLIVGGFWYNDRENFTYHSAIRVKILIMI
jgi:hypothetical protein